MNTLNDMSLCDNNFLSLLDLTESMKEKPLMGRKLSLAERLPSISENQPFMTFNSLANTHQGTTRFNDESPNYLSSSPSSSPTCTSLPANLADLTALLSQLNLHVNLQSAQEEQKPDITIRPFKLNRSVSEPFHQPLSSNLMNGGSGNLKFNSTDSQPVSNSANTSYCRYKTELCRPFEENGSCKYGEKCQFAHGKHELRSLARHPKYKTDLCKTYHTTGLCPYGPRCHFIHNDEERRLNFINRLVLEHKKQQAILDQQNNILKQNQLLAAAVSAQKLCSSNTVFSRQMSIDTAISSVDQLTALLTLQTSLSNLQSTPLQQSWQSSSPQTSPSQSSKNLYQQLRQMSSGGSLGSSGESPSSSIADSPPPSPTMIDDQFMALKSRPNIQTVLETLLKLKQSC